jgi:ligand-binding sensor domain-containing protein/signal transduction histidine kinase
MDRLKRQAVTTFWALGLILAWSSVSEAERLPIKTYTTADGLAHNMVNRIVRDSRGFLWFCTREGLSRFDGYSFTNYGIGQGLPGGAVNDLVETREGVYWVATAGGLCRFDPLGKEQAGINSTSEGQKGPGRAMFAVYFPAGDPRSKQVLSVLQDRSGVIWCGTSNGLYGVETAVDQLKIESVDLGIPDYLQFRTVDCLLEDRRGTLWIGTESGLYRRWPDGRVEAYTSREGLPDNRIHSVLEDREGQIWIGMQLGGLCRLVPDPVPRCNVVARAYSARDGLPTHWINLLFQSTDGTLWAGTNIGLIRLIPTGDGGDFRFLNYSEPHGLSYHEVGCLAEDGNGNLWVGLQPGGAAKIARSGFTTFGKADGFFWSSSIFETRAKDLIVVGAPEPESRLGWSMNRLDANAFIPIRPQFPERIKGAGFGWGWNQTVVEDRAGEWWVAASNGVYRFPRVNKVEQLARTPAKAVYTSRDGLASSAILRLFEDSSGDIWIGSVGQGRGPSGLSRWERRTNSFHQYTEIDNLPRLDTFFVSSFAEDRAGNLWIGFSGEGGLARYHDGAFTLFGQNEGVPAGLIRNMLVDSAGRLWLASYRSGLLRMDDPAATQPKLLAYTTADGLSSNETSVVSEDAWGRIYIGTGRGIDRLDLATGRFKHYTSADGLPLGDMQSSLRDRNGTLWFSSQTGLARLVPEPDREPVAPRILITGLHIAGEALPISALGETDVRALELGPDRNQLQVDFLALGFSPGEGLRYRYKLEGAGDQWSPLADSRTVNFANLAPGPYRFLVQAINADGVTSEKSASVPFTVLAPVWRRWWFLGSAAVLMGAAVFFNLRYRFAQKLKVERVRTRIATDLHDDIGTNLSLIAMASEVARRRSPENDPQMTEAISLISGTTSELVDSISDIVWAVNPGRDHLVDLIARMRRFASDVFSARRIAFRFEAPSDERNIGLGTETRRETLLIYKEAVNNAARHSKCTSADTELEIQGGWLILKLSDNGVGFDVTGGFDGNGLASMGQRAKRIGGALEVVSHKGAGTTLTLTIPLK